MVHSLAYAVAGNRGIDEAAALSTVQDVSWRDALNYFSASIQQSPSTVKAYRKALVPFFKWVENDGKALSSLTRDDIIAWAAWLRQDGNVHSADTVNLYLCALRAFYSWAEGHKLYPDIARGVKGVRKGGLVKFRKQPLTETQATELLDRVSAYIPERALALPCGVTDGPLFTHSRQVCLRNYAMVNLILRCGLRTVEVSRANVMNIDYIDGHRVLYVWGKGRPQPPAGSQPDDYVTLTDAAYEPIAEYLKTRGRPLDSEPLFTCEGYGSRGRRISTRTIQMLIKESLRGIGLDAHAYSAHSLRHTTGEMMVRRGADLLDVQNTMRHHSPLTTQIYIDNVMRKRKLENPAEALLDQCFRSA